jgi:PAS domain S-box-containing protein
MLLRCHSTKRYILTEALDRITENLIALDRDGKITYINQAFADILKLKKWQAIGKNIWTLQPLLVGTIVYQNVIEAIEKKKVKTFEWKSPGSGKVWETTLFPSENGVTALGRDVSEQSNAHEKLVQIARTREAALKNSEDRYRELVEGLPEMVLEVDAQGQVVFANSKVIEITGYSKEELNSGFDANRLVASQDIERSKTNMLRMFAEGKRQSSEYLFVKKDGSFFPVLLNSIPILEDNKIVGIRGIIVDITDIKKLEQKLKENERLAAIGATAGWVGHDIRNPLQAMLSEAYLLRDYLASMPESPIKKEVAESLAGLESNIGYINKIVADLQDYSRPLKPESVNLNLYELVTEVFVPFELPHNLAPSIDIEPSLRFKSDPILLRRIITNLVINAIQAMPDGGKLSISCCERNEQISLIVEDTGIGIPDVLKPKLFTPMVTTKAKGQGLGLAVVRRLVEALNGTIGFESQEGKGTKFIIDLPFNR